MRAIGWARGHALELVLLGLGVTVRLLAGASIPVESGYDFHEHWPHVEWYGRHASIAPLALSRTAYHPPLYYAMGGVVLRLGGGPDAMQTLSIALGCARLVLVWLALERLLPGQRLARCTALALAAVLPASVHLDAMATQESLANLLAVAAVLAMLAIFRAPTRRRWRIAPALGLIVGLALLTKISALALFAAVPLAAAIELALGRGVDFRQRLARAAPWLAAAAVAIALAGGWFAHNQRAHGQAILSGWHHRPTEDTRRVGAERTAPLDRRTLGYFLGWSPQVWRFPYYPSAVEPESRLWPVLVASTFADYYNYRFAPPVDGGGQVIANGRPLGARALAMSRLSVQAGTLIAAVTVAAWLAAAIRLARRRESARTAVLGFSALAFAGQAVFATRYPYDFEGVVKGIYLHFGSLPLYAAFGTATAWLWRARAARALALACLAAVAAVASYTVYCGVA